ncbi:MAG TPA: DUF1080 domain-containing protein [Gemmatimonadales bacterium]|nr:DUF1080 domain-containing protein [Gemmatimonadales bacterium]
MNVFRIFLAGALAAGAPLPLMAQAADWPIHSMERPEPRPVKPAPVRPPAAPPSDALVLFAGGTLAAWEGQRGGPARWRATKDYFEVTPATGAIRTKAAFGDAQIHIEWRSPEPAAGEGQDRGNSGVFLMGRYEIQILDSYQNRTYADGQAGAMYGQYPPLVNASRPPGQWQTYDIVFRRPRFDANGALVSPARVTLLHNGVLVQDGVELTGPVAHGERPPYEPHADRLPLSLQDHGHRVQFRNVWVRNLETPAR